MKLVYFVVDKLSEWLEGNPYRLAALAFVPVAAFLAIAIANEEIGYTIYSWGGLTLETQSEIYTIASLCWASSTYFFLYAINNKSALVRHLTWAITFSGAYTIYNATHVTF